MEKNVENIKKRAIVSRIESRNYGIAFYYVFLNDVKQKERARQRLALVADSEGLYPLALESMVGDEIIIDSYGKIADICPKYMWGRAKNCWYLLKNRLRKH